MTIFNTDKIPTDRADIIRAMITIQKETAADLMESAERDLKDLDTPDPMTRFDYSGDHEDYDAAASDVLSRVSARITPWSAGLEEIHPDLIAHLGITEENIHSTHSVHSNFGAFLTELVIDDGDDNYAAALETTNLRDYYTLFNGTPEERLDAFLNNEN